LGVPISRQAYRNHTNNGWQQARREAAYRWFASTTFVIHSRAVRARPALLARIVKHCSATPIIRWPAITRAPDRFTRGRRLSATRAHGRACCTARWRRTWFCARTAWISTGARGTGGQLVPQRSHSQEEDLVFAGKSLKFGAPGRIW